MNESIKEKALDKKPPFFVYVFINTFSVLCRNLLMMDDIRQHCHVIQNICAKRTVAHTILFFWSETHTYMKIELRIAQGLYLIENIHAMISSLSPLLAYGTRKKKEKRRLGRFYSKDIQSEAH